MLGWWLRSHLNKHRISHSEAKFTSVRYLQSKLQLEMDGIDNDALTFLNSDKDTARMVKDALKKVARYDGAFEFAWDIPF